MTRVLEFLKQNKYITVFGKACQIIGILYRDNYVYFRKSAMPSRQAYTRSRRRVGSGGQVRAPLFPPCFSSGIPQCCVSRSLPLRHRKWPRPTTWTPHVNHASRFRPDGRERSDTKVSTGKGIRGRDNQQEGPGRAGLISFSRVISVIRYPLKQENINFFHFIGFKPLFALDKYLNQCKDYTKRVDVADLLNTRADGGCQR